MHNFHKLNIDSNRHTKNIIIVKIVVEDASLCDMRTLLKYAKNAQHAKYGAIANSRKTATCRVDIA